MKMSRNLKWTIFMASLIAGSFGGVAAWAEWGNSGPGTGGASPPHLFTQQDFPSVRQAVREVPHSLSPAILSALGIILNPEGAPPNAPEEFDLRLTTPELLDTPWLPGEIRLLDLLARSSSSRFFRTPPRVDLLLVGPSGGTWLEGSPFMVGGDPIEWIVPDSPPGLYRIYLFDSSTGLSRESDFTFLIGTIEEEEVTPTPTPTPTENIVPTSTPTPTETPVPVPPTETPTPTPTEAPLAVWDWVEM